MKTRQLKSVIAAVRETGLDVAEISVTSDGEVRIKTSAAGSAGVEKGLDYEIEKWERRHA